MGTYKSNPFPLDVFKNLLSLKKFKTSLIFFEFNYTFPINFGVVKIEVKD